MELLPDLRIVDFSTEIAGPYCTKLFADAGADVIKVEASEGDPLRRHSATGGRVEDQDSGLFQFLNGGKRSVIGTPDDPLIAELVQGADLVVESFHPAGCVAADLAAQHPGLVVASISPFGGSGPWRDRPATGFTVEAESGSVGARGRADQPPIHVAGRLFEWMAGAYVAVGALAAVRRARQSGDGEIIDCSLLEVSNLTGATFADLAYQLLGRPEPTGPARTVEAPSVEPTADGFVGFNTNTRQQFNDFLVLIERADLLDDDDWAMAVNRMRRLDEWNEIVHAWTRNHTTAEIVEAASLFRIPVAEVNNGKTVLENEHFRARGVFAEDVDGGFVKPLPPYLIDGERLRPRGRAPRLGEHQGRIEPRQRPVPPRSAQPVPLPLAGIRVVDTTAWWAGPTVTQIMAALGADVIHVESPRRPDAGRTATLGGTHNVSAWWERAFIFLAANTNKRGLTLDMSTPTGLELAERLIAASDVVVENFSPRVFDTFGFSQDRLLGLNPRLVAVRMPAFGLDGPWRDFVGFAQTMEQMTGMAWITGHPDDQPRIPRGPCDPLAGIHAAFAVLLGLSRRDLTGVGVFIEVAMVETALNAAAEQVIEYTAHGRILERQGNRGPDAAPQGLYRCLGPDSWLALAVANDAQWEALKGVLGNPPWVNKPEFSTPAGRRLGHDAIDGELQVFASSCEVSDIVERLVQAGVPAGQVHDPRRMDSHPQLRARGYFEPLDHPVVGPHAVPSLPFRFASLDRWFRTSAPTFGQHNHAILGDILGLDAASIEQLEAEGVIATRPSGL